MSTTLYPRGTDVLANTHRGTNSQNFGGVAVGWAVYAMLTTRGGGVESASGDTQPGPTAGREIGLGATNGGEREWISPPLAEGVTISGAITFNVWAHESHMNANAAINFSVDSIAAIDNALTQIVKSARTTELGTTNPPTAAANFTATPGAGVTLNKGDRIRLRIFADDAGTMGDGHTFTAWFSGTTAGANGDTYVEFTETFTFEDDTATPGGSTLYLTDAVSDVATASVDKLAETGRGSGVVSKVVNTAAGWTNPIQWTDGAGGTVIDWFTHPLASMTLSGMAKANLRLRESAAAANVSVKLEIARVDNDGTNPTVWGSWCMAGNASGSTFEVNATAETAETVIVTGDDLAVSDNQRLRIRVYIDDIAALAMGASETATLWYSGTSGGASGDSYIIFSNALDELVNRVPRFTSYPQILAH